MKLNAHYIIILLLGFVSQAQQETRANGGSSKSEQAKQLNLPKLTLEDAIKIALENNYDIKLSRNDLKIDELNNSAANAGMLPLVSAQIVNNNSVLNTTQTQADGSQRTLDGARNLNLTTGVGLDWTIFDGLRMFARKEQLNILQQQGEAELKLAIFTKVSDVYLTYYEIVQQQQQLNAIDSAIVISNERVTTADNRFQIGKASKLELLNAQVDLNTDTSDFLKQKELLRITKIRLNEILARETATEFSVDDELLIDENVNLDEVKALAIKQNPQLQAQILAKNSAEQQLRQVKAGRYPTVRINSGYNFTRSEASLGFVTQSTGNGFVYGFSASVPIFNGFLQNRNEKIAKLQVENANVVVAQQQTILSSQLDSAYESYITNLELIKLEKKNLEIAEQNLDITRSKFKIGTIIPIEFRTAQQNLLDAKVRYSNALYLTKINEITLKELAGNLTF